MLEKIIVRGGHRLTGDVSLSGGKNTVLKLMAASVMSKGTCIIRNIPDISDVHTMTGVLRGLGVMVDHSQWGTLIIDASNIETFEAPRQL